MKTIALARIAAGLFVLLLAPLAAVQAKEDGTRCPCWYDGYDAFDGKPGQTPDQRRAACKTAPPISSANECDRDQTKQWWTDGCLAHADNEEKKCPYKSMSNSNGN